nr:dihydroxyacetone kinase subunit DhaK [Actinomadura rugatobispora]
MPSRHIVNDPDDLVAEALEGLALAHPDLVRVHFDPAYVVRADGTRGKVALVSGGGSGHEPLHTGFVGAGMLDAAVPGAVFASPTAHQIRAAVTAADGGLGTLLVVKNYTGDVLNFSIAAELAADDGIAVETVLVDDDLATERPDGDGPGRRGTAAVVAVEKICGAAAERGATLAEVAVLGRRVAGAARTMALALEACTHPGRLRPSFEIADDEVEFGVGIHGERGVGRRPRGPARELVAELARPVVEALGLARGASVIAIVNGLGGTHGLELSAAHRELTRLLDGLGITVVRSLVGPYVTALDMKGMSITLVRADDELLDLWDAPVRTPALNWGGR